MTREDDYWTIVSGGPPAAPPPPPVPRTLNSKEAANKAQAAKRPCQ